MSNKEFGNTSQKKFKYRQHEKISSSEPTAGSSMKRFSDTGSKRSLNINRLNLGMDKEVKYYPKNTMSQHVIGINHSSHQLNPLGPRQSSPGVPFSQDFSVNDATLKVKNSVSKLSNLLDDLLSFAQNFEKINNNVQTSNGNSKKVYADVHFDNEGNAAVPVKTNTRNYKRSFPPDFDFTYQCHHQLYSNDYAGTRMERSIEEPKFSLKLGNYNKKFCQCPMELAKKESRNVMNNINESKMHVKGKPFTQIKSQPDKLSFLTGVIAYVDVKIGNLKVSNVLSKHLLSMGAKILSRFTRKVTHVIFKDGDLSTYKKAKMWNVPLVNVMWITDCERSKTLLPIDDYKPSHLDKYKAKLIYTVSKELLNIEKKLSRKYPNLEALKNERKDNLEVVKSNNNGQNICKENETVKQASSFEEYITYTTSSKIKLNEQYQAGVPHKCLKFGKSVENVKQNLVDLKKDRIKETKNALDLNRKRSIINKKVETLGFRNNSGIRKSYFNLSGDLKNGEGVDPARNLKRKFVPNFKKYKSSRIKKVAKKQSRTRNYNLRGKPQPKPSSSTRVLRSNTQTSLCCKNDGRNRCLNITKMNTRSMKNLSKTDQQSCQKTTKKRRRFL